MRSLQHTDYCGSAQRGQRALDRSPSPRGRNDETKICDLLRPVARCLLIGKGRAAKDSVRKMEVAETVYKIFRQPKWFENPSAFHETPLQSAEDKQTTYARFQTQLFHVQRFREDRNVPNGTCARFAGLTRVSIGVSCDLQLAGRYS